MKTAEELHRNEAIPNGSTIYADNRFYSLSDRGIMHLIAADEKGSRIVSKFSIPNAGRQCCLLYLRRADQLFVYDVKAR